MFVWPAVQLVICLGKHLNIGHYLQTVLPNVFMPAMLRGTIDFYDFVPLSMTWVLPGGHMISAKETLLASFSRTFHLSRMKFDVVMKQLKLNIVRLLLRKVIKTREMTAVSLTVSKNFSVGKHLDVYELI